jgi:hypothetical protein
MTPTTKVHLDREKGVIRIVLEGRHTSETIVAAVRSIGHLPEMHRLWDVRRADLSGMDFTVVVGMTDEMASLPHVDPHVRVAILASRDVEFGLSRMFQTLLEGKAPGIVKVFRSTETAEAWLAEPPDSADDP